MFVLTIRFHYLPTFLSLFRLSCPENIPAVFANRSCKLPKEEITKIIIQVIDTYLYYIMLFQVFMKAVDRRSVPNISGNTVAN